jgi:hypothetical protein
MAAVAGGINQHIGVVPQPPSHQESISSALYPGSPSSKLKSSQKTMNFSDRSATRSTISGKSTSSALSTSIKRNPRWQTREAGTNERRFSRFHGAPVNKHVVGQLTTDKLLCVSLDLVLLPIDFFQVVQSHGTNVSDWLQDTPVPNYDCDDTGKRWKHPNRALHNGCGNTASMRSISCSARAKNAIKRSSCHIQER